MSRIDKSLSEQFGVDPIWNPEEVSFPVSEIANKDLVIPVVEDPKQDQTDQEKIESDIEFSRQKLLSLLTKGEDAFEYLLHLAKSEERVNAFEVLNSMLSNMTDMSMKIIDIQEKKKKLLLGGKEKQPESNANNNTTNNIIFTGTTTELQDLIKKQISSNKDDSIIEGD